MTSWWFTLFVTIVVAASPTLTFAFVMVPPFSSSSLPISCHFGTRTTTTTTRTWLSATTSSSLYFASQEEGDGGGDNDDGDDGTQDADQDADTSPSDVGSINDADYPDMDDRADADDGPVKAALLNAIAERAGENAVIFGFGDARKGGEAAKILDLAKSLEDAKYIRPLLSESSSSTMWNLLYTNAPDILGLGRRFTSQLVSIQQEITQAAVGEADTSTTLTWILTYKPNPDGLVNKLVENFVQDLNDDRLTQRVVFTLQENAVANRFDLQLASTTVESTRFGTLPTLPVRGAPRVQEAFEVTFQDGQVRTERSVQGDFLAIYQRVS